MSKKAIQLWTELSAFAFTKGREHTPYQHKLEKFSEEELNFLAEDMLAVLHESPKSDVQKMINSISRRRIDAMCRDILSEYEGRYKEIRPIPPLKPRVASTLAHNFVKRNSLERNPDAIRINVLEAEVTRLKIQLRKSFSQVEDLQQQNVGLCRSIKEFQMLESELAKQRALTDRVRREASLFLFDIRRKRLSRQKFIRDNTSVPTIPGLVDEQYVSSRIGVKEKKVKAAQQALDNLLYAVHANVSNVKKLLLSVESAISALVEDVDTSIFKPYLIVIENAVAELKKTIEEMSAATGLHSIVLVDARLTELAMTTADLLRRTLVYRGGGAPDSRADCARRSIAIPSATQTELSRGGSIHELYDVLDREAGATADRVGSLLTEIRHNATLDVLSRKAQQISESLNTMLTATGSSINKSATATLLVHEKVAFFIENLHECQIRMSRLENQLSRSERSSKIDSQVKQRLAAVSYDIARTTNELVGVVSDSITNLND